MLRRARDFFTANNILEVDTSILSRFAVTDPHTDSLSARSTLEAELYLQTSPEYKMKRLLAAGFGNIFQICKVFRDGELGRNHLTEFTMVEWYRLDFSLQDMMRDTIEFIAASLDRSDLESGANYLSYQEAFESAVNLNPLSATIADLCNCACADAALSDAMGGDRDAWLDLLLTEKVAPAFAADRLTVLFHYPSSQAVLARRCAADASVADRFEVFYGDLELANGFVELTDADEQASRFERDRSFRRASGKTAYRIDRNLIDALRSGLPLCAGVAVGFDRMLMLHTGKSDLGAVTNFIY